MSILDALRVQKANQQSVSQLAALPQNEIIRLAQMGQIPADVVPVVISEKARMAKEMANLQAAMQGGGQQPTVIEQAMQTNAQAEQGMPPQMPPQQAPQMPPQAPQMPPGVAGLPTGQMFQGQNFAAGGIVAFDEGGSVEPSQLARAFANVGKDKVSNKDIETLMAGLGMDSGMVGAVASKMTANDREEMGRALVAQYRAQLGNVTLQGQAVRPMEAPSGVYGLGATASFPVGQGRATAGLDALRTPEGVRQTGYNLGYQGQVGPGQLSAMMSIPKGGGRPGGQLNYRVPFEEGGAVGYNGEEDSFVQGPTGLNVLRSEMPRKQPESLAEYIEQYRAMTGGARRASPEEEAYAAALKKGAMSPEDAKQQQWMRLLQAGLGIMGGTSPYAFTNIGQGSQEALKGYAEDVQRQQAQRMAELRGAAETARGRRLEQMEDIKGGATLYGQERDRAQREQLAKESQLGSKFAQNYLAMKRAGGDQRDDATIMNEGYQEFFKQYGYAQQRVASTAETAAAGIGQRQRSEEQDAREKAVTAWNALKPFDSTKREYEKMRKDNPAKAEEFRNNWIEEQVRLMTPRAAAPAAPAAPSDRLPAAAVSQLKEGFVTQFANGQKWTLENGQPKRVN